MRKDLIDARGSKTQMEVAYDIGVTQKYISKLELGHRNPSLKIASKISKYYKKPIEMLFPDIFLP
ncbi:MAG: helix-turn-helix transcriptional regulator [Lacrimispora sphenoides]